LMISRLSFTPTVAVKQLLSLSSSVASTTQARRRRRRLLVTMSLGDHSARELISILPSLLYKLD
jgi:hypothetical protein